LQVLYFANFANFASVHSIANKRSYKLKHIDLSEWLLVGLVIANESTIDVEPQRG